MTENPSPDTLADASLKSAADGGGTVESPAISLADLNAKLGGNFKDTATALQSLKETKDFVGKRKEDIAAEVKASLITAPASDVASKSDVQALKNELFYSQNPQYKAYESMISKLGENPADIVNMPEMKDVFEKVKVADEVVNNKSVVNSNARLSQVKSVTEQAVAITNSRGSTNEDTALVFAAAINAGNNER